MADDKKKIKKKILKSPSGQERSIEQEKIEKTSEEFGKEEGKEERGVRAEKEISGDRGKVTEVPGVDGRGEHIPSPGVGGIPSSTTAGRSPDVYQSSPMPTTTTTRRPPLRPQVRPPVSPPKFFSFLPRGKIIDFLRFRKLAYIFSAVLFIFSSFMTLSGKVLLGTDFRGGLLADVRFAEPSPSVDIIRATLPGAVIQSSGNNEFLIRLPLDFVDEAKFVGKDAATFLSENLSGIGKFELRKVEMVGSVVGSELRQKGIYAFLLSLFGIFIYIVFRFEWRFALGATLALIHDIMLTLGMMSIFGIELSLVTLAGLLALAGYSVNDSVIIADRVREKLKLARGIWRADTINRAITETLPRTILTVATTMLPVICLILFGGEVLRDLGIVLAFGLIFGTYSSIFVVSALSYDIYMIGRGEKAKGA